ncbi:hypothetical protein BOTBODRAFT_124714 [Botryobasidium botryosum FD-172 SS1]|uniref:DNA repair protein RAD50 n=1 Tax=Botryobasidium botryosum (strain FD-172 SS1) TaxID=930990 RepID=A0A067N9U0_BOTB1|nr:hypothetical protein BOTBODRAFT_124714 [Botryobasidium botryosum FD-172 SS1]
MASLQKLAIRGIRSFDDKSVAMIEFYSPVTVIVGVNGSGKTTIIECLKYITTGDQPPNSRGGAFVHDPKMAKDKEVKAQVKLRFFAANGTKMMASRSMSVTAKKTGLTFKTLESLLAPVDGNKGGKRATISTKCAELDAEIPLLLGVSKAVLENVIFCHQEDSYWPLAEASVLKKKFDDIFEATRYTKALENIKTLRKERVAELKADNERLKSLQIEKSHADKLRAKINALNVSIEAKEQEAQELKTNADRMTIENAKYYELSTQFRETYIKIESLERRKKQLLEDLQTTEQTVEESPDPDEEIEAKLANFDRHISAKTKERGAKMAELQSEQGHLAKVRREQAQTISDHGRLQGEAKNHAQNLASREELIHTLSAKHEIIGFDHSPLEPHEVKDFGARLDAIRQRRDRELETTQKEGRAKMEEFQDTLQALLTEHTRLKQEKDSVLTQISKHQSTIAEQNAKINASSMLDAELRQNEQDFTEKTALFEASKKTLLDAQFDAQITEQSREMARMNAERDELNVELRTLSLQADTRAKFSLKKSDLTKKEGEIRMIIDGNASKFRELVGSDPKVDSMEKDLDKVTIRKDQEVLDLEAKGNAANRELHRIENSISTVKSQLKAKQQEIADIKQEIAEVLDDRSSLSDAIEEANREIKFGKEQKGAMTGADAFYKGILKTAKEHMKCEACDRRLKDKAEFAKLEKFILEKIASCTAEKLKENDAVLESWEEELDQLQNLAPKEATMERLRKTEVPELEAELHELERKLESALNDAEKANEQLKTAKNTLKDIQTLKAHASLVARTQGDVVRLKREISDLERDLAATGSTQTTDDVQGKIDAIDIKIKAADRKKHSLAAGKELQTSKMRGHESEMHALQLKGADLDRKLAERNALSEHRDSLRREIALYQTQSKELDVKIEASSEPIQHMENQRKEYSSSLNNRITQAQSLAQELNRHVDQFASIGRTIDQYIRERRERKLEILAARVTELEGEIDGLTSTIDAGHEVVRKIDKEINEGGATLSRYRDTLRLRKLRREIQAIQVEIDSYDIAETARARENFNKEYKAMTDKLDAVKTQHARLSGQLVTENSQRETYERDLARDFKDINKRHTDQLVRVKMSDMANNDLEKYAKALDNAIMKYHSLKMEEVNDTMQHLWSKTYQGTDIDGIKIRSDSEGGATKRTYNYRVVMTKDEVEMDMRGRCSAGQKMLASIIIRLALSDSFGQNCGILALDEPTNALDVENIEALALSLVDIINERRTHSNFQLLIITHDENFLTMLGEAGVMEYFWRVQRDSKLKSIITRERIANKV